MQFIALSDTYVSQSRRIKHQLFNWCGKLLSSGTNWITDALCEANNWRNSWHSMSIFALNVALSAVLLYVWTCGLRNSVTTTVVYSLARTLLFFFADSFDLRVVYLHSKHLSLRIRVVSLSICKLPPEVWQFLISRGVMRSFNFHLGHPRTSRSRRTLRSLQSCPDFCAFVEHVAIF